MLLLGRCELPGFDSVSVISDQVLLVASDLLVGMRLVQCCANMLNPFTSLACCSWKHKM